MPLAESRIRVPDDVSISLSPVIATLMFPNVPPPPVKLFDPAFTAPLTVSDPDTDTLSSRVVVPPAESIVRLPEEVSISL